MPLIIFWIAWQALAQKPSDIPLKIDKANKAVRQLTGPSCDDCGFNAGQEEDTPAWKQCLQIVCGHHLNADNKMLERVLAVPYPLSEAYKEIGPLVKKAYRSQVESELAASRTALKYFDEKIEDPEADRFAKLVLAVEFIDQLEYNSAGELDESKTYDKLISSRSSAETQLIIEVGKKVGDLLKKSDPLFADDFEFVRQEMPEKDIRLAIEKANAELSTLSKDVESITGLPEDILSSPQARLRRDQRLKDGSFDAHDIDDLKSDVFSHRFFKTLFTDEKLKDKADQISGSYREKANLAKLKDNIKVMEEFLNSSSSSQSPLASDEIHHHIKCYTAVALSDHSAPNPSTIRRYNQFDEPAIRGKYLEKLKGYLSPASSQSIGNAVKKWKLKPPESAPAFKSRLKSSLESLAADNANLIKALEKPREPKWGARLASLFSSLRESETLNTILASDIDDVCVKDIPNRFGDQAFLFDGKFELGIRAMDENRTSDGTVMHEYSHLISGLVQTDPSVSGPTKKWYNDTRSCLAQGHSESGEKLAEEDFADMLAASFAGGGKQFCELIPEGAEYFTLKNWNSSDPTHSGHLYRVLHYRVLTGEGVPPICKSALAEKGESPFERNCLKETPEASMRATK